MFNFHPAYLIFFYELLTGAMIEQIIRTWFHTFQRFLTDFQPDQNGSRGRRIRLQHLVAPAAVRVRPRPSEPPYRFKSADGFGRKNTPFNQEFNRRVNLIYTDFNL